MAQDLRNMFSNEDDWSSDKLNDGHEKRFAAKLDRALPREKSGNKFLFLKIAAVLLVAFGVGFAFFTTQSEPVDNGNSIVETSVEEQEEEIIPEKEFHVSDVSPEFKKIENYYLASLNFELATLEVTEENKALLDSFMEQLSELEKEYRRLNNEFSELGANEQTVEAMIVNLQLRLELLYKLKNKINEIKQSKNRQNEEYQA